MTSNSTCGRGLLDVEAGLGTFAPGTASESKLISTCSQACSQVATTFQGLFATIILLVFQHSEQQSPVSVDAEASHTFFPVAADDWAQAAPVASVTPAAIAASANIGRPAAGSDTAADA